MKHYLVGAGGFHESLLAVETKKSNGDYTSFNLDDIVERRIHP